MADQNHTHGAVRPRTAVLTRGFDPALSVGSARPAVFRSSTYVFPSPEEAEHAFAITTGKIQMENGGRADLIYSRFSHPNAEILEDQIVPLDAGASYAAVFNSGMAAIMTACFAYARPDSTMVYTTPLYGGTTGLIHRFLKPLGVTGIPVASGRTEAIEEAILGATNCCMVFLETPANPTMIMTDIARAAAAARAISVMIMVGLAGVSRNTMQQFFAPRMASSMASVLPEATGIPVTPSGFRNLWISPVVPPYSGVVYTIVLSGRA